MKAFVIYDSMHGNTEQIARIVGQTIGAPAIRVSDVNPADVRGADLLIVGSPTHGGFSTEGIDKWLKALPTLAGVSVAAFDTRTQRTTFGYAAPRISRQLTSKGGSLLVPAEGFFVLGKQGPLKDGELERAASWAKQVADVRASHIQVPRNDTADAAEKIIGEMS